jgi:hypothetical protein
MAGDIFWDLVHWTWLLVYQLYEYQAGFLPVRFEKGAILAAVSITRPRIVIILFCILYEHVVE